MVKVARDSSQTPLDSVGEAVVVAVQVQAVQVGHVTPVVPPGTAKGYRTVVGRPVVVSVVGAEGAVMAIPKRVPP